ncbi:MAG: hypothetical protein JSV38_05085 [Desulfobacterales bacterium]|nr:MAG: hypothetical protein JSV38_05085 [Desulfobacterales bacterium]
MGKEKGMHVYHLQHYTNPGHRPVRRKKENPIIFGPFAVNNHDWGLRSHRFEEFPSTQLKTVSSSIYDGKAVTPANYKKIHLKNIITFTLHVSIIEGFHAIILFLKDITKNRVLKKILSVIKKPKFLKKISLYEQKIDGPWQL